MDIIREYGNASNFYITEVNSNPGTGIIDITGYNHFADLIRHIEIKVGTTASSTNTIVSSPPAPPTNQEEAHVYPPDYIALVIKQGSQNLSATEQGLLAFYRMRYGRIRVKKINL